MSFDTLFWTLHSLVPTTTSTKECSSGLESLILSSPQLCSWLLSLVRWSLYRLIMFEPDWWISTVKLKGTDLITEDTLTSLSNSLFMNQTQDLCMPGSTHILWPPMFMPGSQSESQNASLKAGKERMVSWNGKFDYRSLINSFFALNEIYKSNLKKIY